MDKKGQGLSLNTIIIAIVVLVVLVVLIMVFTGYFAKLFTPGVTSCSNAGGRCIAGNEGDLCSGLLGDVEPIPRECPDPVNQICCPVGSGEATEGGGGGGDDDLVLTIPNLNPEETSQGT